MANYVDNEKFLEALKEYKLLVDEASRNGLPKPRLSNYIGECILLIATRVSYKRNFINYSYRDEMIADGIENCIRYISSFDPEKSDNPFAYFTQVVSFAAIRRLVKEKRQAYIRSKLIQEMPFEMFDLQDHEDDEAFQNTYIEYMQNNPPQEPPASKRKKRKVEEISDLGEFV